MNNLFNRIEALVACHEELETLITGPSIIADGRHFATLSKKYTHLGEILEAGAQYKQLLTQQEEVESTLQDNDNDEELRAMARELLAEAKGESPKMGEEIKLLLLPNDPENDKNAILELRTGTGGDEAALFAGDLLRMYSRYCETKGQNVTVSSYTEGGTRSYKEIVLNVTGTGVYGTFRYESGVRRVQRIPQTEAQGRIHASTATVTVLPEADKFEVNINEGEIKQDILCPGGVGGQNVNKVESGVRLHYPWRNPNTGVVEDTTIECIETRDQPKDKERALSRLRTFIYDKKHQKYIDEIASHCKMVVSTDDRSARIRTYNFPQGRVTDHRIGLTVHDLPGVLDGDLQPIIDALIAAENTERLRETIL